LKFGFCHLLFLLERLGAAHNLGNLGSNGALARTVIF
jgi:hypothetical protein